MTEINGIKVVATHRSMIHARCPTGLQAWDYYEIEASFEQFMEAESFERALNGYREAPAQALQEQLAEQLLAELGAIKIKLTGRHGRTTTTVEATWNK